MAYHYPDVAEDDLMMIRLSKHCSTVHLQNSKFKLSYFSEGDVFISSPNVLAPLKDLKFRLELFQPLSLLINPAMWRTLMV